MIYILNPPYYIFFFLMKSNSACVLLCFEFYLFGLVFFYYTQSSGFYIFYILCPKSQDNTVHTLPSWNSSRSVRKSTKLSNNGGRSHWTGCVQCFTSRWGHCCCRGNDPLSEVSFLCQRDIIRIFFHFLSLHSLLFFSLLLFRIISFFKSHSCILCSLFIFIFSCFYFTLIFCTLFSLFLVLLSLFLSFHFSVSFMLFAFCLLNNKPIECDFV